MKWILSLFLCFSSSAQLPVIPFNPSTASAFTPRSIPNLTLWWVHTNETVGATVQDWPDLIQQTHAVNVTLGNSPTNAAIGMRFQSKYLFVTNWTGFSTNDGFFIICQFEGNASQRGFITGRDNANAATKYSGVNGSQHWVSLSADISGQALTTGASQLLVYSGVGSTTPSYTNGVLVSAAGAPFANTAKPYAVTNMGFDPNFDGSGGIYIMEIGWYKGQSLTATDNYNLSNYWKTFYP